MAREIPEVVRAAAGLAATVVDEARKLPETLPGLPVRLIGLAMQQAMKVQQQYAGFVARGDELFTGLRGEDEPGLATFDDDVDDTPAGGGFRDSAFDRASAEPTSADTLVDPEVGSLPADPPADAVTAVIDELADQVEDGRQSIEQLAEESPGTADILDEIAIDELVDQAPGLDETAPSVSDADSPELEAALLSSDDLPATAADTLDAEPTADVSTSVDVLTPAGDVATVDAAVTDEGIAAPEVTDADANQAPATPAKKAVKKAAPGKRAARKAAPAATDTDATDTDTDAGPATATDEGGSPVAAATGVRTDVGESDTAEEDAAIAQGAAIDAIGEASAAPTDDPGGGSELSGSQAAGTAPIDGYDSFSVAQLRGRLRGYALSTVQDLLTYEEATRAREPYLRMLRNRLEKLEEQAVAASPLAPRGA
ncbi:hypothetical protein [Blastococcus sp. CT_GayMR20]|uniref:hypothetical protein n=1 Tax=Blastococcus sp. CT_GayMR20 TaxID=2559609 RepID=UPI001431E6BC|nr:hypothetical protein [Blastococcus sp. CT_GayMR20]